MCLRVLWKNYSCMRNNIHEANWLTNKILEKEKNEGGLSLSLRIKATEIGKVPWEKISNEGLKNESLLTSFISLSDTCLESLTVFRKMINELVNRLATDLEK